MADQNMSPLDQRLQQPSGALDAALGVGPADPANFGRLGANISELEQLRGQKAPSPLDILTSPEGLIKLGLGVAGMLSGNENLQAGGVGLAMGSLLGAPDRAAEIFDQHQKRVQDLSKQVMTQQQQIVSLLQSQPNLFLDEEGKSLYSGEQWKTILGGIQVNPVRRLIDQGMTDEQRARLQFLTEAAKMAAVNGRQQAAQSLGRRISDELQLDLSDDEIASVYEAPDDDTLLRSLLPRSTFATIQAVIQAKEENPGTSYLDHAYLLQKMPDQVTLSPSERATQMELEALALVQQRYAGLKDEDKAYFSLPENREELFRLALQDRTDLLTVAQDAFEETSGYNLFKDMTVAQMQTMLDKSSFRTQFALMGAKTQTERIAILDTYMKEVEKIRTMLMGRQGTRQEAVKYLTMNDEELVAELARARAEASNQPEE